MFFPFTKWHCHLSNYVSRVPHPHTQHWDPVSITLDVHLTWRYWWLNKTGDNSRHYCSWAHWRNSWCGHFVERERERERVTVCEGHRLMVRERERERERPCVKLTLPCYLCSLIVNETPMKTYIELVRLSYRIFCRVGNCLCDLWFVGPY